MTITKILNFGAHMKNFGAHKKNVPDLVRVIGAVTHSLTHPSEQTHGQDPEILLYKFCCQHQHCSVFMFSGFDI